MLPLLNNGLFIFGFSLAYAIVKEKLDKRKSKEQTEKQQPKEKKKKEKPIKEKSEDNLLTVCKVDPLRNTKIIETLNFAMDHKITHSIFITILCEHNTKIVSCEVGSNGDACIVLENGGQYYVASSTGVRVYNKNTKEHMFRDILYTLNYSRDT